MRRVFVVFLIVQLFGGSLAALAQSAESAQGEDRIEWSETSRDVRVDGRLEPQARVLAGENRLAIVLSEGTALVVDETEGTVATLAADALVDEPDRLHATSPPPVPSEVWRATELPDGWWLSDGSRHLLISPHLGPAGSLDRATLFEAAPRWRLAAEAYSPDAEAVDTLRQVAEPTELLVVLGTWCGDSRRSVPRLLAALDAAANPKISLDLVGIRRGFEEPLDFAREHRVTNVPTVIVRQAGREIGRFVERPVAASVEVDLAGILVGAEPVGFDVSRPFADTDRPLVTGRYGLHDPSGERIGEEDFTLFATESDGHRLLARLVDPAGEIEVHQRLDEENHGEFVEITRRIDGAELSRTRLWVEDGLGGTREARSTTRGDVTGIVRQVASLPAGTSVGVPVASAVGWLWLQAGRPETAHDLDVYFWGGAGKPAAGRLQSANITLDGVESVDGVAGAIEAKRIVLDLGGQTSTWWLHPTLDVPLRGELESGAKVVLEAFEPTDPR